MSWRSTRLAILVRDLGRILGINQWIAGWLNSRGHYEERYEQMFCSSLQSGDIVWDVGANVGHYVGKFSECVGDQGQVFAFEPSSSNFAQLVAACQGLCNVHLRQRFRESRRSTCICARH